MTLGRTAVVGGTGFIGRHVVSTLLDDGVDVFVIAHQDDPGAAVEVRTTDATDRDAVIAAMSGADTVIHLAARAGGIQMQSGQEVYAANRTITDNVLTACETVGVQRIFFASSQVVYRPKPTPLSEDDPVVSVTDDPSPYAWSKAVDEVVVRWWADAHDVEMTIGRFGNIYGEGAPYEASRSTVIHALTKRIVDAEASGEVDVWGDGSATRSFLYVTDAARAVVDVVAMGSGVYNIDSGQPVTIRTVAETIAEHVSHEITLRFDASKPAGAPYRVGDVSRLAGLVWSAAVDLGDGIDRTIDDYRSGAAARPSG